MSRTWSPFFLGSVSAFESDGPEDRPPVILLHGAGGNALTWLGVVAAFEHHRVLLVDMPAHGSSASPAGWDLRDTAALVAEAARPWLAGRTAIWGGHSWGGKVAALVAATRPDLVDALVLFDPSPCAAVPVPIEDFVDGTWRVEMQPHDSPAAAARAARTLPHWQPWDDVAERAFAHGLEQRADGTWSLRPTRDELVALATATLHVDRTDELSTLANVPTLLLVAEQSRPWQALTNMAVLSHASHVEIPGHHWIHQAGREACITAVRDWLGGRSS